MAHYLCYCNGNLMLLLSKVCEAVIKTETLNLNILAEKQTTGSILIPIVNIEQFLTAESFLPLFLIQSCPFRFPPPSLLHRESLWPILILALIIMLLGDQNPGIVTGQVTGGVSSNNNDVIVYRVYLNFSW